MATQEVREGKIVGGPGTWKFILGVFEGHYLRFEVDTPLPGTPTKGFEPITVVVYGVDTMDPVHRSTWSIRGDVVQEKWDNEAQRSKPYDFEVVGKIEACFNVRTSKGTYKITPVTPS